jgi:hypothetical protein
LLDSELFKHNANLECLNLSKNSLLKIDDDLFDQLINLRRLCLNGNPLDKISEKTFKNQKYLVSVNLSDNKTMNPNIIQLLRKNSQIRSIYLN